MIGVYNAMAKMIWPIYFIENQGYKIVHNRLMYDNKSAIFLEKMASYPALSGPNTSILGTSL